MCYQIIFSGTGGSTIEKLTSSSASDTKCDNLPNSDVLDESPSATLFFITATRALKSAGVEVRLGDPGKVFDLTLPLDKVAEGYRAMDEYRAIKTLLRP